MGLKEDEDDEDREEDSEDVQSMDEMSHLMMKRSRRWTCQAMHRTRTRG